MVSGSGGWRFWTGPQGLSMVHCLQMEAGTSPTVLVFLTELSALDWAASLCQEEEEIVPLLV